MFKEIMNWFKGKHLQSKYFQKEKVLKMYVLVRQDLDETYRCVQGTHSVCQYALEAFKCSPHNTLFRTWNNQTIVFLGVRNYQHLKQWKDTINNLGIFHIPFHEPDLDNQLTAIACIHTGEIFSKLPVTQ